MSRRVPYSELLLLVLVHLSQSSIVDTGGADCAHVSVERPVKHHGDITKLLLTLVDS